LLIDGPDVEIIAGSSRDQDRRVGAGTYIAKLDKGRIIYQCSPDLNPVLQKRFLANALGWLATRATTETKRPPQPSRRPSGFVDPP
jgi:hypothetical protein